MISPITTPTKQPNVTANQTLARPARSVQPAAAAPSRNIPFTPNSQIQIPEPTMKRPAAINMEYRNAAAHWGVGFNGDILLEFQADAGLGESKSLLVRLSGGACQGAAFVDPAAAAASGFALEAPFTLWKEILERRTLAATAILRGRPEALVAWSRALAREARPDTLVLPIPDGVPDLPPVLDKPARLDRLAAALVACLRAA